MAMVLTACSLSHQNPPEVHGAELRVEGPCSREGHELGAPCLMCAVCHRARWQREWVLTSASFLLGQLHSSTRHTREAGGKINLCLCLPGPIPEGAALEGECSSQALWFGVRVLLSCAVLGAGAWVC